MNSYRWDPQILDVATLIVHQTHMRCPTYDEIFSRHLHLPAYANQTLYIEPSSLSAHTPVGLPQNPT